MHEWYKKKADEAFERLKAAFEAGDEKAQQAAALDYKNYQQGAKQHEAND